MADETPGLHVDTDWKKQAQEEKRKLAEAEQQKAAAAPAAGAVTPPGVAPGPAGRGGGRQPRELPPASVGTLVQSIVAQALFYLGELQQGPEPTVNLDMAKYQIDTLSVLEEKTANNLTPEEKRLLDAALYETRMRYVNVASQYA